MRTNISIDEKLWEQGIIEIDPQLGIKSWHQHRYHLGHDLHRDPLSPWNELAADCVTQALKTPHPSDSRVPDQELNKTPTRDEVKNMVQKIRENGENVTSFWGIAFVASDMGWP